MKFTATVAAAALACAFASSLVHAQTNAPTNTATWQMPPDSERCPSKWGAGDQRGSGNWMKPETVLRATRLIKTGEVFELGDILSPDPKDTFVNNSRTDNLTTEDSSEAVEYQLSWHNSDCLGCAVPA